MYKNLKSTIDITLTIAIVFIQFSIDYVYGSNLYPCFSKKRRSSILLFTRKSKKGQRHQQRTALSMSLPLGAPVFRSISMPIVYFLHCLFFPIVTISCPPMSSHSFVSWHEIFLVHEYYYNKKAEFFEHSFLS